MPLLHIFAFSHCKIWRQKFLANRLLNYSKWNLILCKVLPLNLWRLCQAILFLLPHFPGHEKGMMHDVTDWVNCYVLQRHWKKWGILFVYVYIYIIYNFCILHITYIFYISVHLCIRDQIGMRRYQTSYRTCQYHWFCSYSDWMVSKSRILSTATESSLASAHVLQHSAGPVCLICPGYYSAMLPPK